MKNKAYKDTSETLYWNENSDKIKLSLLENLTKQSLTLDAAIEIAILNNKNLQATYENLGIASADYRKAGLLKNPVFQFAYQFSTSNAQPSQIITQLMQNFIEIFLIPLKQKVANNQIEITKNNVLEKVYETIANTKIAFKNVQIDYEIWQVTKDMFLAKELELDAALLFFNEGNTTLLSLTEREEEVELMRLELLSVETNYLNQKERLYKILGLFGKDISWEISKKREPLPVFSKNIDEIESLEPLAVNNNLSLKNDFINLKKIAGSFKIDTSRILLSDLALGPSAQKQEGVWFLGPQINTPIPIFDIGRANREKAKATIAHCYKKLLAKICEVRAQTRILFQNNKNSKKQAQITLSTIIPIANKRFEEVFKQHNAVQFGIFILLNAKIDQLEKKILLLRLEKKFQRDHAYLEALIHGKIIKDSR